VYNAILLYRALGRKSIGDESTELIRHVGEFCKTGRTDQAIGICQQPPVWHTALAQLMAVALANRPKGLAKIKQLLVMEFHTEVIAGLENRLASISTIVRMGPLLGLLGTVASMIGAFGRIGGSEKVAPAALAADISLALWATGSGLLIATPMMIVGNDIHARLRRLRDVTERQLQDFIEVLEDLEGRNRPATPSRSAARAVLPH
jgi:biopolymer transport protein ExbB